MAPNVLVSWLDSSESVFNSLTPMIPLVMRESQLKETVIGIYWLKFQGSSKCGCGWLQEQLAPAFWGLSPLLSLYLISLMWQLDGFWELWAYTILEDEREIIFLPITRWNPYRKKYYWPCLGHVPSPREVTVGWR